LGSINGGKQLFEFGYEVLNVNYRTLISQLLCSRLWRLARVTQWCSVGVTHAENGTGNEMWKGRRHPRRRRAHGGIGEAGDIIHAAGVRVAVSSSASQARTVNGGEETGWICLP
jgi:hypothetical protein